MTTCFQSLLNFVCCINKGKYPTPYDFYFNGRSSEPMNQISFETNFVKTSKYTWYNFIPKALLLQFMRLANVYFLIIAILQTIPAISPLTPTTAWIPLLVVLTISMVRQGYQDYQRYLSDKKMNYESQAFVRKNGTFQKVKWSQVIVGDICKVQEGQSFPADLILLSSSQEGGVAFIETASLDGETNLKVRSSHKQTIKYGSQQQLSKMHGQWFGVIPDKELHQFLSKMTIGDSVVDFRDDTQLLYRGAKLKNTKWVIGLVIYTGRNTKIMLNSQSQNEKMSQIQRKVNFILIFILLVQLLCCLVVAIFHAYFRRANQAQYTYIQWQQYTIAGHSVIIFLTYFVLINTMIPISLIVSIQIVKFSQSYFISKDKLMYSELRKKYVEVKSSSLNQQLGQIEYIFTDKTGTLTMNLMEFKIAVIGTKMYGDLALISNNPNDIPQDSKIFQDQRLKALVERGEGNERLAQPISVKNREGGQEIVFNSTKELSDQFLQILSLAHMVVVQEDSNHQLHYKGTSPDEITLVTAAKGMNFEFIKSTQSSTTVKIRGKQITFELLDLFAFNSDRKRMSVLIRSGNTIKMYTKGADNVINQRLSPSNQLKLDDQLRKFSLIGLRTLLIAMRTVSQTQYDTFKKNIQSLPSQNKEKALNELISEMEKNLYLIGATAVLDRLQEEVPQTIRDLIRANIKIWMLTGDKLETAQNIAKSCNLIQNSFQVIKYELQPGADIYLYLKSLIARMEKLTAEGKPKAFLIEGKNLGPIIEQQLLQTQLANLAKNCQAVVCCRLLPIQKANVVSIVRQKLNKITLSIGDGANDVPMIKTAHIGVGLFGEEGQGAVNSSDYALPQFRMLWRLLLVHGRWNYIRISQMILYFFYKNMLFTIPQFIIAFYNGYSGQTIFDDIYISLYNLIFTALPLIIRAVLEQDINYVSPSNNNHPNLQNTLSTLTNKQRKQNKYLPKEYRINRFFFRLFPKIYFMGQENLIFNYTNYVLWITEGIAEAILISLFCINIIGNTSLNQSGINSDYWIVGLTIFSSVILVVTFKLATHTKFWSVLLIIAIVFFSLGMYIAYMWASNYVFSDYILGTTYVAWTTLETYLVVLFCVCLVLFIDGLVVYIDFNRGGYASRMREVIKAQKQITKAYLQQMSLKYTDGLSEVNNKNKVISNHVPPSYI